MITPEGVSVEEVSIWEGSYTQTVSSEESESLSFSQISNLISRIFKVIDKMDTLML